jgi:hypothetical protein
MIVRTQEALRIHTLEVEVGLMSVHPPHVKSMFIIAMCVVLLISGGQIVHIAGAILVILPVMIADIQEAYRTLIPEVGLISVHQVSVRNM